MTTTADPKRADTSPSAPPIDVPPIPVVAATRRRRRPLLVVASLALVCLGGLLAAWAWSATSSTVSVLAARATVERGALITEGDLMTVSVNADPALRPVKAGDANDIVGRRASSDIAAGTLITRSQVAENLVPAEGSSLVGIGLPAAAMPGEPLRPGDPVRVVATPGEQGELGDVVPAVTSATVVSVSSDEVTGMRVVTVSVPQGDAAVLAARVSTGNVALVLDSRQR
ncbi:SAF domain-containing protein [Phycicoccus avicenniae]|uniref:SAF domain-containing protein n=1 Tax=Phycicoccus avicenniae TaxID=2828860 RepID=UPI003D2E9835